MITFYDYILLDLRNLRLTTVGEYFEFLEQKKIEHSSGMVFFFIIHQVLQISIIPTDEI